MGRQQEEEDDSLSGALWCLPHTDMSLAQQRHFGSHHSKLDVG